MLNSLKLHAVGPATDLEMKLSSRLNIITGDNGLGKSFLLDVAWWALTRTWARELVVPHRPPADPTIQATFGGRKATARPWVANFDRETDSWRIPPGRPAIPGLVIYAQVDGGFSVWDPSRNYWKKDIPDRPPAYLFKPSEVWNGNDYCEGLIRDLASWQRENGDAFSIFKDVLVALSPNESDPILPGELRKLTLDDPKRYPTLHMSYGQDVPVIHASAGVRRILALAYLLVWTWREHLEAGEIRGDNPAREIIFLVDEIEAHLHPQWQRRIVPALLKVMDALTGEHSVSTQLITATHSPLVLASVEPHFDTETDSVFLLEMREVEANKRRVVLEHLRWKKEGDVINWLVSEAFGLEQARSIEAERAIEAAEAFMRGDSTALPEDLSTKEQIQVELVRVLSDIDEFWSRWIGASDRQEAAR